MARRKHTSYDDSPGLFDIIGNDNVGEEPAPFEPLLTPKPISRLKFISFGSGSSGNCAYLGNERYGILIDAGVEPDRIYDKLLHNGVTMDMIGGIILTHDHGDHIRYAYNIVRKHRHMRIYCTPRTLNGILRRHNVSRRIKDFHQPIFKEFTFNLSDFSITPFETSHDGSDNVGFMIEFEDQKFVVATDMGTITERADFYIRQANHLMIEANYDLQMLINGPYREYLKARILSPTGHMDNQATAQYLGRIYSSALRNVFLCHLSQDNNLPEIALEAVVSAFRNLGLKVGDASGSVSSRDANIQVLALPRFDSTATLVLK